MYLFFKRFGQKAPLHLSLSHSGEQEEGKRGREYLSSLLRFVRASGISKLLLYTDLLRDRRQSRQSVRLVFTQICSLSDLLQRCCAASQTCAAWFILNISLVFTSIRTSVRAASCRWPSWLGRASPRLWRWAPPWTSSLVSFCRDGSTWESPPASWEDLWPSERDPKELIRLTQVVSAGYCTCILRHKFLHVMKTNK